MGKIEPLLPPDGVDRLREALVRSGYTAAGVAAKLGPAAAAALRRNDPRAALRGTPDGDQLAGLIRLFLCGHALDGPATARALAPLLVDDAARAGLVRSASDGWRAALELEPYGEAWWVLSDLPEHRLDGPLPADHVLGAGAASITLADATIRTPVGSALDVGTGCGVQALRLSDHAERVTATDLSDRALRFAATAAALAGLGWELLCGDLLQPVRGRRFDLVVSNPPFVIGPGRATHAYRDSGRAGDAVCAELAAAAPGLLNPGGTMQYLANWVHRRGEPWAERVAGWFAGTGLDVWAIQREVTDPVAYVRLWLSDAAQIDPEYANQWLDWFDAHDIEAVGFGLITVRAGGHHDPVVRCEDLRQPLDAPLGPHVQAWFDRRGRLAEASQADLLDWSYRQATPLRLCQEASPGEDGWQVDRQLLVLPSGLRWTEEVDPLVLALVSGCDGSVALRSQLAVLAAAHDLDEAVLAEAAVPIVSHLVERGFIVPL